MNEQNTDRHKAEPGFFSRATRRRPAMLATVGMAAVAALGAMQFRTPLSDVTAPTFLERAVPMAEPSQTALGASGGVLVKFALPGEHVEYPLAVHGDPVSLSYEWIRNGDSVAATSARPLLGARVLAPPRAGFYRLRLVRGDSRRTVDGLTLAVLVPFREKTGTTLNGYRIGTYLAEKAGASTATPAGFLEITDKDADLRISKHLRVSDFLTHDGQQTWPRYAAVTPELLDKIELVVKELARWHGDEGTVNLALDVHSGFRTPHHNSRVRRAARDSQHQYGEAADIAIDANGDGKYSAIDSRLVGLAVEIVELKHPHLVGGLGVYTSGHSRTNYVHIDARGARARWRG